MFFANDADAAGWMAPTGAPAVFKPQEYTLTNPTCYAPGAEDFTAQTTAFKKAGCELVCGSNDPAEFSNFWKQSHEQSFRPKLVGSGRAGEDAC